MEPTKPSLDSTDNQPNIDAPLPPKPVPDANVPPQPLNPNIVVPATAQIPSPPAAQPANPNPNQFHSRGMGPEPIIGNFGPDLPGPNNSKKKKVIIAGGFAIIAVLAVTGFVFGHYVPNKPENAYRTGIERSGDAIHKMILESTEADKLEQLKKSELEGSLKVTSEFINLDGTFYAKLDPTKSDSKLDVTFKEEGGSEKKIGLKLLTELQDGKRFPNSYFQLTGIKDLGLDGFVPGVSDYDGKWISVEAEYLETLGEGYLPPEEKKNKENVTAEEIAELIRTVSESNNDYLFSTDPEKAVIENREYIGKEKTSEGINSFHYKVGINKNNAVKYCKDLSSKVLSTKAVKKFMDADDKEIEEQKKSADESCNDTAKDIKDDETFDMWVDAKYKIIHKLRFYEEKDKKDKYTDVGQVYTGGDKLSFFTTYHDDKDNFNAKFTLDVDVKELNSKAEITASQEGDSKFNGTGNITAKPYAGEINTDKPEGVIPIDEILKKFGYDPTSHSGISQSPAARNEHARKCAAAYEYQANNNGRGEVPPGCE